METESKAQNRDDSQKDEIHWDWASAIAEGIPPSARGGHTATLVGSCIVIFAGHYYAGKNEGFVYLNDTHFLDVKQSKWIKPYCTGKIPPPRYNHSAIYAGGIIIVFGGKGPKNTVYNDLYTFDPDPKKFIWLLANETGEAPAPRYGHTANLYNKKMYIFGGWNGRHYFNDVITFDLEKMAWNKLETAGPSPMARQGHASCVVGHNLIIQGGFSFNESKYKKSLDNYGTFLKNCYLNDIKLLDLKDNTWVQLRTNGQPPTARFGHTLSFVNNQLIIFGGWSCHSGRRFNAISGNSENEFVEETDYFYSLDTSNLVWSKSTFGGDLPSNRYGHSATVFRHNILYFGGWEFGKALNDINILLAK